MATYYTSASNQRDGIPMQSFPDGQVLPSGMMMYLNQSASVASYSDGVSGNHQLQLQCGEFPSTGNSRSISSSQSGTPYDMWSDGRNDMQILHPMSGAMATQSIGKHVDSENNLVYGPGTEDSQLGLSIQMENSPRGPNLHGQGLSLSLSTEVQTGVPASLFHNSGLNLGLSTFLNSYSGDGGHGGGLYGDGMIAQSRPSGYAGYTQTDFSRENYKAVKTEDVPKYMQSNKLSGLSTVIPNSRYLKVVPQLLNEIVDVRKAPGEESSKQHNLGVGSKFSKTNDTEQKDDQEPKTNPAGELSPANSQDLQNKMSELLSMLDEVDRRYKLYYQQMQIVASYFDGIVGNGASKPYTTLALLTISRHFRCVRDAISGQIKVIRSSLGEEDTVGNTKEVGISRLRFVEQKVRQQRALQQLGMMQQHAWRPQRGLPETSVTILRAWLFEHFLHPYPKDSDKIILARQTGLTRGQVSNWFINARVRLWKPMIEDMYKEEIGDSEMDSNSSSDNTPKATSHIIKDSDDIGDAYQKNINTAFIDKGHINNFQEAQAEFSNRTEISRHLSGDSGQIDIEGMKFVSEQRPDLVNARYSQDVLVQSDASAAYQMAELEMFGSQGGISLTLGLQHLESTTHENFGAIQGDEIYNALASSVEPNDADMSGMNPDNQQYRFGVSHSIHDFAG